MSDQFVVRLLQPVPPTTRKHIAERAAPRFGVVTSKLEKLLARDPGLVTRPASRAEAEHVADIFTSVGVDVEVAPYPVAEADSPAVTAQATTAPAVAAFPTNAQVPTDWQQAPASSPARDSQPSFPEGDDASSFGDGLNDAILWSSASAAANAATAPELGRVPSIPTGRTSADDAAETAEPATAEATARKGQRFSLRWKLLLTTLIPIILLAAATLYFAYNSVRSSTVRLLTEVGDNIALTLAADLSTFMTENGLQLDNPADQNQIVAYFGRKLVAIDAGLHETVGVHLTDATGQRIVGSWESEIQSNPNFNSFTQRFDEATQAALQNANFGDSPEALAASLPARTRVFEDFYVVAQPLINDLGTVQVILSEGNIIQTALSVIQPIIIAAAVALLIAIIITVILAVRLTRRIRRLATVADRISLGELDEPVEARGNDEVRDVAEALERMRLSLKSAIERLRRRGRKSRATN